MDKKNRLGGKKEVKAVGSFSLSYWKIFNISLFGSGMSEVLMIIEEWIKSKAKGKWIATVNPEFVMRALKDNSFREILKETDLNVVDGVGLIWAQQMLRPKSQFLISNVKLFRAIKIGGEILKGKHREGLVSGVDLMLEVCKVASDKSYKVFFLGGFGDRAERTAQYFKSQFLISNDKIDWCAGEPEVNNEQVLKQINEFKPDILFVAYGMKKQEEWIKNNKNKADFGVAIGVGRSFDYYSSDLKRAPKVVRKMGMEWLYSLIKEPKRWRRQLELPKFVWKVLTNS